MKLAALPDGTMTAVELVVTTRDDMFDICRALAHALDPAALDDPAAPVVVSVNGTYESGKKIVMDAMREVVGDGYRMHFFGNEGFDEHYRTHSLQGREIFFMDLAYTKGYKRRGFDYELNEMKKQEDLLRLRRRGGLTVLQNTSKPAAGMQVWVEKPPNLLDPTQSWRWGTVGETAVRNPYKIPQLDKHSLAGVFKAATRNKRPVWRWKKPPDWLRRVRIDIDDPRIFDTPAMQATLARLRDAAYDVQVALLHHKKHVNHLPVRPYGRALPQPRMGA
jgi:hypothetical protein